MRASSTLSYLPAMFATCMLFQAIYVLCLLLWVFFPDFQGHALLSQIFPGFKMLDIFNFLYGFIASALYGWAVAITFVFFYNLWPGVASVVFGVRSEPS